MALFSTIRSAERSPPRHDRSVEDHRSPHREQEQAEAPFTLPRHLLVSLAGLTADVAHLQQHCDDAREVEVALDTMLGKLDDLVDSIYQRAAVPSAPRTHPAGFAPASPSDALADRAVDPEVANTLAHPPTDSARPLSDRHA